MRRGILRRAVAGTVVPPWACPCWVTAKEVVPRLGSRAYCCAVPLSGPARSALNGGSRAGCLRFRLPGRVVSRLGCAAGRTASARLTAGRVAAGCRGSFQRPGGVECPGTARRRVPAGSGSGQEITRMASSGQPMAGRLARRWHGMGKPRRKPGLTCGDTGSRDRTRTYNLPVNSRTLCRLSYAGLVSARRGCVWFRSCPDGVAQIRVAHLGAGRLSPGSGPRQAGWPGRPPP